jgi:membrane dipeptidase
VLAARRGAQGSENAAASGACGLAAGAGRLIRPRAAPAVDRRQLLRTGLLGGLALLAAPLLNRGRCRLLAEPAVEVSTRAVDLVLGSTVVDMLSLLTLDWPQLYRWYRRPGDFGESDFRRLEASGINVFHPAVETSGFDAYSAVRSWMAGWSRLLGRDGCFLSPIESSAELRLVPALGKIGVVVGFQNSNHFRAAADVEAFFRLGQRVSQLTYNERNRLGCGCQVRRDHGLTAYGAEVVAEMNRVGMAVDVSHCGERTSREAIACSRRPVLVTHANCRALVPGQPRCKSDALIRELAAGGGVMGITAVRAFVSSGARPTLDDLLDHFEHAARVAGVEHVGLGSDVDLTGLDPQTGRPLPYYRIEGLDPALRAFQIADGLLRRGFGARDVELILGGNFRRALTAIWPPGDAAGEERERRDPFCPAPHPRVPAHRPA